MAVACAGLLSFTACNDFLDEEPKSTLTNVGYYQTQAQMEAAVNNLYRNGAMESYIDFGSAYTGPFAAIQEELTGYFTNSYEGQEIVCLYSRRLERQLNTMQLASKMDGVWDNCYQGINRANAVIMHMPDVQEIDQAVANRLVAEAKFFRAYNYFHLVKTFGAVPFYTEPYESAENMELPRTETATIYAQIEADLNDAVNGLPAATFTANGHRVTRYVAAMVLADVYMYEHKYAEALNPLQIVLDSPHSLTANIDLAENSAYNQLRSMDDLDESIYAFEYNNEISPSNWLPTYAFDGDAASNGLFGTYAITQKVHGPIDRYLNIYEEGDLRVQPNQFFHWTYTNPNTGQVWNSVGNAACCWYYYDEEALLNSGRGTKDWNLYRYAETLLDAAECIAQSTGVNAEAAGYLAQIKARANLGTVADLTTELQGLSKDAFIQECWNERLREMPLEFKMWDLCVRVGMFPNISETTPGEITWINLVGATNASGFAIKDTDLLWPLSVNEIQRNPNLEQNPGYTRE